MLLRSFLYAVEPSTPVQQPPLHLQPPPPNTATQGLLVRYSRGSAVPAPNCQAIGSSVSSTPARFLVQTRALFVGNRHVDTAIAGVGDAEGKHQPPPASTAVAHTRCLRYHAT